MALDADALYALAKEQERDNRNFLHWLRYRCTWSSRRLARLEREIAARVWAEIDCTGCANCCRRMQLEVTKKDCADLARLLGMKPAQFLEQEVERHRQGFLCLRQFPCRFLDGNHCTVYEQRPNRCRGFPYLTGTVRDDISGTLVKSLYCPIVFQFLEEMKAHPDLQRRRRRRGAGEGAGE